MSNGAGKNSVQRTGSAAELIPERPTLPKLREAAAECQACDLWRTGTQTVFGEGKAHAQLMFVGEQPGDYEDRQGHPFGGITLRDACCV